MNKSNEELYLELKEKMFEALESDDFYNIFNNSIRSGKNNFSLYQRYMNSVIDIKWVEKIEDSLLALDNIIRNPQRFIKETEEVIPVEQAKKVSEHSIKHLAQNTNLIAKIDEKGFITPSKILNIQKDETFETYENRFIYTLLIHLQYFIDKRLKALHDARVNSEYKIEMENEFVIGNEKISYQFSMTSTEKTEKRSKDLDINADTSQMDATHRVERLIQIMYDFQNSQFIKSLKGVTLVKPPIMRTNVILKNPNFKKALELWQYIETYYDAGLSIELVENEVVPSEEYINDLFNSTLINYCIFNHHNKPAKQLASKSPLLKKFKPNFVQHIVKEYLDDLQIDVDIVEKVFVDKIKRATAKRKELDKSIAKAIEQAIEKETKNLEKQKLQDERRIKQALKEAKKRQKQEEARLKKLEDDRLKEIAELEAKQEEAKAQQLEEIKNEIAELEANKEEIIVEQQINEPDIIDLTDDFINPENSEIVDSNDASSVTEEEAVSEEVIDEVKEIVEEANETLEEETTIQENSIDVVSEEQKETIEEQTQESVESIIDNNEEQEVESINEIEDIKEDLTEKEEIKEIEEKDLDNETEKVNDSSSTVKAKENKEGSFISKIFGIFRKDKSKDLKAMAKKLEEERLEYLKNEEEALKEESETIIQEKVVEEISSNEKIEEVVQEEVVEENTSEDVIQEVVKEEVVDENISEDVIQEVIQEKVVEDAKKKTSTKASNNKKKSSATKKATAKKKSSTTKKTTSPKAKENADVTEKKESAKKQTAKKKPSTTKKKTSSPKTKVSVESAEKSESTKKQTAKKENTSKKTTSPKVEAKAEGNALKESTTSKKKSKTQSNRKASQAKKAEETVKKPQTSKNYIKKYNKRKRGLSFKVIENNNKNTQQK